MNVPIVKVSHISVAFEGVTALDDVSFEVSEGSFVAIIGANGSGKSTLLNALLGLEKLKHGSVQLFGADPWEARADEIGYLPQLKTLDPTFPAIALELVVSGLRHSWPWRIRDGERAAAIEAMRRTGVDDLAERRVAALSGGELQRVYLARSLVHRPRLLLLDEPGAGMDVTGEAEMYHLLEEYRGQTKATVLMVTHDWEGARAHATHVLVIDRRLVGFGSPEEWAAEARLLEVFGHKGHIGATHGDARDA